MRGCEGGGVCGCEGGGVCGCVEEEVCAGNMCEGERIFASVYVRASVVCCMLYVVCVCQVGYKGWSVRE